MRMYEYTFMLKNGTQYHILIEAETRDESETRCNTFMRECSFYTLIDDTKPCHFLRSYFKGSSYQHAYLEG